MSSLTVANVRTWLLLACLVQACGDKPATAPERAAPERAAAEPARVATPAPAPAPAPEPTSSGSQPSAATEPSATPDAKPAAPVGEHGAKHPQKPDAQATKQTAQPQETSAPSEEKPAQPAAPTAALACGEKGQPRCPLQAWMEDHLQSALDHEDLPTLAKGLTRATGFVPDPSWNSGAQGWATIASGAADAAKQADLATVKAACKSCHKTWRAKYKQMFRTRPIAD